MELSGSDTWVVLPSRPIIQFLPTRVTKSIKVRADCRYNNLRDCNRGGGPRLLGTFPAPLKRDIMNKRTFLTTIAMMFVIITASFTIVGDVDAESTGESTSASVSTYTVSNQNDLDAAIANIADDGTATITLSEGTYTLYNSSYGDKNLTFNGGKGVIFDESGLDNEFYGSELVFTHIPHP